jgi:hypothetical protein
MTPLELSVFARRVAKVGKNAKARRLARAYLELVDEREDARAALRTLLFRVDSAIAELDSEEAVLG